MSRILIVLDKENADIVTCQCSERSWITPAPIKNDLYILSMKWEDHVVNHDPAVEYVIREVEDSEIYE